MAYLTIPSPICDLTLFEENGKLVSLDWGAVDDGEETPLLLEAARQIDAYFEGRLKDFDLPLDPPGSDFQKNVWRIMQEIPYGRILRYGDISNRLKSSPRAVGGACGRNPLPIIIPCHRVIAGNGALTGYSGFGGTDTKKYLLALEGFDLTKGQ
ncbi:MAG TPA: methylated-DNA--[protein]-cysteine S-methyltransferase [Candidatus Sulfotelmatobacter sp.]|jgi:methylated-DNA-[protein]-cysteine S-methyltransferase|nr:methylated-DNA--[protein]-cysteine S-methyltransferase [Candidatus Sulfotelmatobacter sp.]